MTTSNLPAMAGQQQRQLGYDGLIKPEQVLKLPLAALGNDESARQRYHNGVTQLCQVIQSKPQASREHQQALERLHNVTNQIKQTMQRFQEQQQQQQQRDPMQQNGMRPQPTGHHGQPFQQAQQAPQANQHMQNIQTAAQANPTRPNFSQKVLEKVKNFAFVIPPSVEAQGPPAVSKYMSEAKMRYAKVLHSYENANEIAEKFERAFKERQNRNPPMTPVEVQQLQDRGKPLMAAREEARNMVKNFVDLQAKFKMEQQGSGGVEHMKRESSQNGGGQPNLPQGQQGQAHTVSSAVEAARSSQPDANDVAKANAASGPNIQPQVNQPANSQQPTHPQVPQAQPEPSVKPEERPQDQRISTSQTHAPSQTPATAQAFPLSHEAAMQQARSYSNPSVTTPLPPNGAQNTPHGHPTQQRMASQSEHPQLSSNHQKMAIPKDLNIPPPQPVPMGQSRPTFTNGPLPPGPIGQPAIQRHPGYVLEGEGERVLSKKKLEELVRQVTGSTGGESDEGETLSAEVEEVH